MTFEPIDILRICLAVIMLRTSYWKLWGAPDRAWNYYVRLGAASHKAFTAVAVAELIAGILLILDVLTPWVSAALCILMLRYIYAQAHPKTETGELHYALLLATSFLVITLSYL